jgi:hypothetical protein
MDLSHWHVHALILMRAQRNMVNSGAKGMRCDGHMDDRGRAQKDPEGV